MLSSSTKTPPFGEIGSTRMHQQRIADLPNGYRMLRSIRKPSDWTSPVCDRRSSLVLRIRSFGVSHRALIPFRNLLSAADVVKCGTSLVVG